VKKSITNSARRATLVTDVGEDEDHVDQSYTFLETQHERLAAVEDSLLESIEQIVPSEGSQEMTVTQLARLCQSLHHLNCALTDRLETLINQQLIMEAQQQKQEQAPASTSARRFSSVHHFRRSDHEQLESATELENGVDATNISIGSKPRISHPPLRFSSARRSSQTLDPVEAWRARHSTTTLPEPHATPACEEDEAQSSDNDSRMTSSQIYDDESVSLATTVKGQGYFQKMAMQQLGELKEEPSSTSNSKSSIQDSEEAPVVEVLVEDASQSHLQGSRYDDTFDQSIMNDETSILVDCPARCRVDESLLVTPVLQRYRLEPDDSSIGVRVVPNKRGQGMQQRSCANTDMQGHKNLLTDSASLDYRHAEQALSKETNVLPIIEETLSPNVSVRKTRKTRSLVEDEAPLEDLRRRPFSTVQPIKTETNEKLKHNKTKSSQSKTTSISRRLYDFQTPTFTKIWVEVLSEDEYHSAPSVVKMQVGFDEVNAAIGLLNVWFISNKDSDVRLDVATASRILNMAPRKSKSLMMSLCHWRRMNMYSDEGMANLYFTPNLRIPSRLTL
jgi:hypothetical protein